MFCPFRALLNWKRKCLMGNSFRGRKQQKKWTLCWKTKELKTGIFTIWFLFGENMYLKLITLSINFRFPLFTAIHRICLGEIPPEQMINCIRNHPEHMWVSEHRWHAYSWSKSICVCHRMWHNSVLLRLIISRVLKRIFISTSLLTPIY